MTTLTAEQTQAIAETVTRMHLPSGIGTAEAACSIAAINLALTGTLTDDIPECMSEVIGRWVIITQDRMSDEARNADAWKALLPLAAGTGREREQESLAIALDAMWEALAWVQPSADRHGFGEAWATMTLKRTAATARAAAYAAYAARTSAAADASSADAYAYAARASASSADAYAYAARASAAADTAYADAYAVAARAATDAAYAAAVSAAASADASAAAAADTAVARARYDAWAVATLDRLVAA